MLNGSPEAGHGVVVHQENIASHKSSSTCSKNRDWSEDNVIGKGLLFLPVEGIPVHDANISEVLEAGGVITGENWQSSREKVTGGHVDGDQDVDE